MFVCFNSFFLNKHLNQENFCSACCSGTVTFILQWNCGVAADTGWVGYSRDQLIVLKPAGLSIRPTEVPAEIWRQKHQGCRDGGQKRRRKETARQSRLKERRRVKPCLLFIIMGNVRLLAKKMDELTALARSQKEYQDYSLICFTKSQIHQDIPDDDASVEGFHRDSAASSKQNEGEACHFC